MNAITKLAEPWFKKTTNKAFVELYRATAETFLDTLEDGSVDLVVTSPPYCMGKEYEKTVSVSDFIVAHERILPRVARVLKPGGSVCWQVGHHVMDGVTIPLDALVYSAAANTPSLKLRNRLIWTFGHGAHASTRFSGRHETILWFTKGDEYFFDLDPVRVPQRYPGKRHYKGNKKGQLSGNPLGKNPGDVWDIPNVKARHVEKTTHPCQFPVALPRRLILALTKPGEIVVDPYVGSGSAGVAAALEQRSFIGNDIKTKYLEIARRRISAALQGEALVRPDAPPRIPDPREAVAKLPTAFELARLRK